MLSKEQIKAASDRPKTWLAIPEWTPEGETHDPDKHGVYVGAMSGTERDSYEVDMMRKKGQSEGDNLRNLRATLAVRTVQDAEGNRLFADDDIGWLSNKSAAALDRIATVSAKLNRLSQADVDELIKN
jgi:hypothetical protein